jgi:Holliday junction DNA helicase RuvA
MIHYITGVVKERNEQLLIVEIGQWALALMVPDSQQFPLHESILVYLHVHWNAEQGPSLFGFSSELEKRIFLLVTSCSGIGPKIGLAILADLGVQRFLTAVQLNESSTLSKVSGIGAKKAEQIILQLRDKVAKLCASGILINNAESLTHWHTVTQALESLNYSRPEITRTLTHLKKTVGDTESSFDQLMRQALSFLATHA